MSKNKSSKREVMSEAREHCSKCLSTSFAVSTDPMQTRMCSCGNRWSPKTKDQLAYDSLKVDYNKLLAYSGLLHKTVGELIDQLEKAEKSDSVITYEDVLDKLVKSKNLGREISQKVLS